MELLDEDSDDEVDVLELELLLVLMLELEVEMELLLSSSNIRTHNLSQLLGPGNCRSAVWKCNTSQSDRSPLDLVSRSSARQIWFLAKLTVTDSTLPAKFVSINGNGIESSPEIG
jgi:hypothetical protein